MFLDPKNRRLGDFVAGTVVVHERKDEAQQPLWDNEGTANGNAVKADVAALLTMQEFELIEAFLSRRLDLTPEARHDTAERIARRVGDKLSVSADARGPDEDFLESVVHQYRDTAHFRVR